MVRRGYRGGDSLRYRMGGKMSFDAAIHLIEFVIVAGTAAVLWVVHKGRPGKG